mmetsp:Transcript_8271/g.16491  ORF Transcript_8271/g.16491 Transcript_8271/m.16491 type:complete len:230 (+) Transcript_8271:740-1429(+)
MIKAGLARFARRAHGVVLGGAVARHVLAVSARSAIIAPRVVGVCAGIQPRFARYACGGRAASRAGVVYSPVTSPGCIHPQFTWVAISANRVKNPAAAPKRVLGSVRARLTLLALCVRRAGAIYVDELAVLASATCLAGGVDSPVTSPVCVRALSTFGAMSAKRVMNSVAAPNLVLGPDRARSARIAICVCCSSAIVPGELAIRARLAVCAVRIQGCGAPSPSPLSNPAF